MEQNPLNAQQVLFAYVGAFVDELTRSGVRHVVICPGSRSTPLAMMFARQAENADNPIKVWMHIDERSAAFFALGMAKVSRVPVALVCTSGTAAANFYPAIVEAHYSRIPLIVLTADRPPELRHVGAPQTIDQIKMYADYPKLFMEMPTPDASPDMLRFVRSTANRAVATAQFTPSGVVHLNFPFREPLVPLPYDDSQRIDLDTPRTERPYTWVDHDDVDPFLAGENRTPFKQHERGLIIWGGFDSWLLSVDTESLVALVQHLINTLHYPILADALSNLRGIGNAPVITNYDAFLRDSSFAERMSPDVVLQIGALPTSKPLLQYLQKHRHATVIRVTDAVQSWVDPSFTSGSVLVTEPEEFLTALANRTPFRTSSEWEQAWYSASSDATTAVTTTLNGFTEPFEGRVFPELAEIMPNGSTLFVSSSMPVRDMDTFFPAVEKDIRFYSNRGANGIDGVVSSALGAAAAQPDRRTVLVIGDLAFYHDMNGLLASKLHKLNLTIVLINNDGGGIFSFLPQAAHPEHFELLYGTPTGLDFRHTAELYGAHYHRMAHSDWSDFRAAVSRGTSEGGLHIVEVRTDREKNVTMHREVWKAVSEAIKPMLEKAQR
jgi:2-succinyl-5-enolpyruvyl-6-hydroxy-3-cyclohexene-1-carboxylate synthase